VAFWGCVWNNAVSKWLIESSKSAWHIWHFCSVWFTNNSKRVCNEMIDVFHRRCLRSILGISWRHHITNDELTARSGQMSLHYTVAIRWRRFIGHILWLWQPVQLVSPWNGGQKMVRGGLEDQGGHGKTHWKKTWTYWVLTGVTREILPTIVPDRDNLSPNVLIKTGGTKSK